MLLLVLAHAASQAQQGLSSDSLNCFELFKALRL